MCGIVGYINSNQVREKDLHLMNRAVSHRGPDASGIFINKGGTAGLGHRRLSIIDLESGKQPMSDDEGLIWITFNGEIYNYIELKEDLQNKYDFKTKSDTEVLIYLYKEYGEKCLKYIRGMFSFAIFDMREDKLFAARDHLGQKPFYYHHDDKIFLFASEIKGILALRPDLKEMDNQALYEYLTLRIITPPRSMFRKIRKLAPGHCLTLKCGKLNIKQYWKLQYEPKYNIGFEDICRQLDDKIAETVKYHMVSDVPVGAFLSGGLDSSLILANMTKFTSDSILTFSGSVPYQDYSESAYAKLVADRYNTNHHELTIEPSLVESLPELVWHLDEPSDPLAVCMYYISRLTRKHVKVVLGGDGGDELFGGYDRYYGNVLTSYYALMPEVIRKNIVGKMIKLFPETFWYRSYSHQLRWVNMLSFYGEGTRYAKSLGYFYFISDEFKKSLYTKDFIKSIGMFDPEQSIREYYESDSASNAIDRMLHTDSMTRMPDHPNMILDRMTMAHGLESRSPFLDHKLAEFCAKIPVKYKVSGRKRRYIQTVLCGKYLPKEILQRPKQGFSSPLPYMLKNEFEHLYKTFLKDSTIVNAGIFREKAIEDLLKEHMDKKRDHGQRLWLLCNIELWHRMYVEGTSNRELNEMLSYKK